MSAAVSIPFPIVWEAIERLLASQPVVLCAGCRIIMNMSSRLEYHARSCPFAEEGTETEVLDYPNLAAADADGPVYQQPRMMT